MNHIYRQLCIYAVFCFFLTLSSPIRATHIVGGEVNYRCLGNNMYEISVRVFRDCDTGVPWFDNPASVGIFDVNNNLVFDLRLLMRENDTLDLNLSDPCLVAPPNVCIHTSSYLDTVMLPFRPGGYQVVYQRCCRNQDIVNIVNPLGTGATYACLITEQALLGCNSSAVFNDWPPVYICAGRPIFFDHSATDADGDSLVYEMCTPLDGATPADPMPQPPYNPPYNPVTWLAPFGVNNMMGGPDSLRINAHSGLLQGTPNILGVFVVGICVKEYRNGVLISTSRRDFQYAVGTCGQLVSSAFFAPEIQCDNSLLVNFQNNSNSLGTGYVWSFGDSSTNATSTLVNPVYIYPDTGLYTITLIADPGTLCADTSVQVINLQYESIIMDFDVSVVDCSDSLRLQVTDLTIDTISTIVDWNWTFGNGDTDNVPFASTVYTQSGTYPIHLQVTAANGCQADLYDTISLSLPDISTPDTIAICPGQPNVVLNPGGNPSHQYQWSPGTNLSSTTAASPIASPTATTTYQVTVTAFNGVDTCILYRSVTVVLPPPLILQPTRDTATCNDTLILFANTNVPASIEWSYFPSFSPLYSTLNPAPILVPLAPASINLYVRATDAFGCQARDTVKIMGANLPILADFSYAFQGCGEQLTVQFTDQTIDTSQGPIVGWNWTFGNGTFSTQQDPVATYTSNGSYVIKLTVISSLGCVGLHQDTIPNIGLPVLVGRDTAGICQGQSSVQLNIGGNPSYQYHWAPATGLSSTSIASPIASPTVPTTYTVTITAVNGLDTCVNVDTVFVGFPPPISVSVPDATYCGSQVTLTATSSTAVSYQWSGNASFFVILANGNPVTLTPTTFPYSGYYVRATDAYGCTASDFSLVQQITTPVNVNFTNTSLSCDDTLTMRFNNTTVIPAGTTISNITWTVTGNQFYQTSNQINPVFNFVNGGTYTVQLSIQLSNGCSGSIVRVFDFNIASLPSPGIVPICGGASSVSLNPGGDSTGVSYQWSPATGLSSTTSHNPLATPPSLPFVYTVTITATNAFGNCVAVHSVPVVTAPPISMALVPDTTFCSNLFFVYATPSAGVTQWEWALDPTFSSPFLTNVNPVVINFGNFDLTYVLYIRAYDEYGCSTVDTGIYNFITTPVPVNAQAVSVGCDNDSLLVQFTDLTVPSFGTISSWSWDFGNGNVSAQQNPSFLYGAADTTHYYSLVVQLSNGCMGTFIDSLDYQLPAFSGADSIGLCGNTAPLQLNPGGNPNLIYQWSPATGLSSSTVASPILTPNGNITYTVTITAPNNGDTCVAIQYLSVFADDFIFDVMPDTLVCSNGVNLFVNSPSATQVTWALDPNFNQIIGFGNPFFTNLNNDRMFYVRAVNAFGCSATDSVLIRVHKTPILVNFAMSPIACGDSLAIQFEDQTVDTLGNPISSWLWTFGTGDSATIQNPNYTYLQQGNYQVTLWVNTESGCTGQQTQPLLLQFPSLGTGNDTLLSCAGSPVALNPNADTTLSYIWSPALGLNDPFSPNPIANPSGQQTYTVTITAVSQLGNLVDSCILVRTVTVAIAPALTLQAAGDSLACTTTVNLSAASNFGTQYQWALTADFANIISTQATFSTQQNNNTQVYYVQTTDAFGCTAIDSVTILQRQLLAQLDSSAVACPNEPATLQVTNLNGSDNLTYLWSPDSLLLSGQGTAQISSAPSSNTLFTVYLSNQYGCTDTLQSLVTVSGSFPSLDITAQPDTVFVGEAAQLMATQNSDYTYIWTPNTTLSNLNIFNPLASPTEATMYFLTVQDLSGCKNRDSIIIYTKNFVCEEPYIFVPNTFTPDGDGLNDLLFVRGNVITELYFAVYNRWGEKMFETSNQTSGWDGTFKGQQLSPDVYGYYLRYKCIGQSASDKPQFKKGNVTLIR